MSRGRVSLVESYIFIQLSTGRGEFLMRRYGFQPPRPSSPSSSPEAVLTMVALGAAEGSRDDTATAFLEIREVGADYAYLIISNPEVPVIGLRERSHDQPRSRGVHEAEGIGGGRCGRRGTTQ